MFPPSALNPPCHTMPWIHHAIQCPGSTMPHSPLNSPCYTVPWIHHATQFPESTVLPSALDPTCHTVPWIHNALDPLCHPVPWIQHAMQSPESTMLHINALKMLCFDLHMEICCCMKTPLASTCYFKCSEVILDLHLVHSDMNMNVRHSSTVLLHCRNNGSHFMLLLQHGFYTLCIYLLLDYDSCRLIKVSMSLGNIRTYVASKLSHRCERIILNYCF